MFPISDPSLFVAHVCTSLVECIRWGNRYCYGALQRMEREDDQGSVRIQVSRGAVVFLLFTLTPCSWRTPQLTWPRFSFFCSSTLSCFYSIPTLFCLLFPVFEASSLRSSHFMIAGTLSQAIILTSYSMAKGTHSRVFSSLEAFDS